LSLVPAGLSPPLRSRSEFELLVCALDASFVEKVDAQLEYRSSEDFRIQANIKDRAAQQLLKLLFDAANDDTPTDRLYTDHLAQALAFRFLVLAKASAPRPAAPAAAALPHHAMRRVEARMRDLEGDLSLEALAKESGYSPIHFSRMFRTATGRTPHSYIVRLRVERARQLLANPSLSLTEIALECGFSSHSHMTRTFHELVGMTPSAFRRSR
jgi:AraC family transcriptional regulator